jgi:hypothetical protein
VSFSDLFKYAGLAFKYAPLGIAGIKAARNNADIMALIDAVPLIIRDIAGTTDDPGSLHETLVKHGVDTKKLAEEIHPVGPQPEGPGLGGNV